MSAAAEQADPTPGPPMNAGPGAAVIPLTKHRPGRSRTSRGRQPAMTTPGPDTPGQQPPATDASELAELVERSMLEIGHSLTEPATREVYLRTVQWFQTLIEGSHATGILDARQHADMATMVADLKRAPGLV